MTAGPGVHIAQGGGGSSSGILCRCQKCTSYHLSKQQKKLFSLCSVTDLTLENLPLKGGGLVGGNTGRASPQVTFTAMVKFRLPVGAVSYLPRRLQDAGVP